MSFVFRLLKLLSWFSLIVLLALLVQFNGAAMSMAEIFVPGSGWVVCLALIGLELIACVMLGAAWFPRASKLVLRENPTDEERRAFAGELTRRLRSNRHVRAAGLKPDSPDFLPEALRLLDAVADGVIRSDAKKIFLGTALSQNGKLDALIVFLALSRMVWRVSAVYNQRPSVREIWSVYSAVSSSAFISFSIEALDIPRTITEAMGALIPSVTPSLTTASIPVVGSSLQYFTTSMIDGAANALLAVRAGIIARNAFRFSALPQEGSLRQTCAGQSGAMLLAISHECVEEIVETLREQFRSLTSDVVGRAAEKTRHAAGSVVRATAGVAEAAGAVVRQAVRGGERECPAGGAPVEEAGEVASENGGRGEDARSFRIALGERLRDACPAGLFRRPGADEVFALALVLLWVEGRPGGRRRRQLCRYALREGVGESLLRYLDTRPTLDDLWPLLKIWRKRADQVLEIMTAYAPGLTATTPDAGQRLRELESRLKLGNALEHVIFEQDTTRGGEQPGRK